MPPSVALVLAIELGPALSRCLIGVAFPDAVLRARCKSDYALRDEKVAAKS